MQPLMPPIDSSDKLFHDGNPLTGEKGTIVTALFLNNTQSAIRDQQSELIAILTAAGLVPNSDSAGQLWSALQKLTLLRKNPFSEIKSDQTVSVALSNLGLGDGSAIPIGVPVPWPTSTPPTGWLKCNGAAFSATDYPQLAKVYPALKLLDLRGEFIRGWDDGRGVDSGRGIGTSQAGTGMRTGALDYFGTDSTTSGATVGTAYNQADSVTRTQPADAKTPDNGTLGAILNDNTIQGTQTQSGVPSGGIWITSRPRNIALNYIVRAA